MLALLHFGGSAKVSEVAEIRSKQLEAILDVARSAVAAFDRDGKLIHINVSEQQIFARSAESSALGQSVHDYVAHNRWRNINNEPLELNELPIFRAMRGEEVFEERLIVERGDGDFRYILQNARPLMIDGEFEGAVMLTLDLSDLREVQDSNYTAHLENAVRRSRMIADIVMEINDNTSALNLDKMTDFAIERISREFKAKSGALWLIDDADRLTLSATHNTDRSELDPEGYHLDSFAFAHEALNRNQPLVVDGKELEAPEAVNQCMAGAESVLVIPLRIRGERVGLAYLCIDDHYVLHQSDRLFASVWGRQCAQGIEVAQLFEQVEAANERLVNVIDQMPQGVLLVDAASQEVRIANSGAETMFGQLFDEPVSITDIPMTNSDGQPLTGSQHPLMRVMHSGERIVGETVIIPLPNGTVKEVVGNHVAIQDGRGHIVGGISVFQDRADFAAMDRSRDEFISVVAHELRNPLTSLRGNLQLLQRRTRRRTDEVAESDLNRIDVALGEADRIGDLVSRVLDVSRVGLDRLDIKPEPCDAVTLVREACEAARARNPRREIECIHPETLPVEWDAARIHQVLGNLTQNADRYAGDSKVVVQLSMTEQNRVRISVRDHGPGVPPEIRRRLFRQYYRFDDGSADSMNMMTDGSRGLGIGLYVSARLVKLHGGRMRVQDANGGGAEFIIELPVVAAPALKQASHENEETTDNVSAVGS